MSAIDITLFTVHGTFAFLALIEACKFTERCIYGDFGDIEVHFPSKKMGLDALLSIQQCTFKRNKYTLSDILKAGHWLSIMRAFSILPVLILLPIVLLPLLEFLFISELNVSFLVNTFIWPTLYIIEIVILLLRIFSRSIRILKAMHKEYAHISIYSILLFKYLKK